MDCSPEYVVDYYLDDLKGPESERRCVKNGEVQYKKEHEYHMDNSFKDEFENEPMKYDQLFSNDNREERTFKIVRQEKLDDLEESFYSQFELPNQPVKQDEIVIDEQCDERELPLDECFDSQFQFRNELVRQDKQVLTEQQETAGENVLQENDMCFDSRTSDHLKQNRTFLDDDNAESDTLTIVQKEKSIQWDESFEKKNKLKNEFIKHDLTTIYEQEPHSYEKEKEAQLDRTPLVKNRNKKGNLEKVEKDKEYPTDKAYQIFLNPDSYEPLYQKEYQMDESTEQKLSEEATKIHRTFQKLVVNTRNAKKKETQLKQKSNNNIWTKWIEMSTTIIKRELELSKMLEPKLKEIESLKEGLLPFPNSSSCKSSDLKLLTDTYNDYKESIISSLNQAKTNLEEINNGLQEQMTGIDQKLNQLWRLFGRLELQDDRNEIHNLQQHVSDMTKLVSTHLQYLDTHFKLPSK